MSRTLWGVLVWLPAFLSLELTSYFWKACPWPTLSETVWRLIAFWHPFWYFVLLAMVVLVGHFGYHWRVRYLIAASVAGAVAILLHLLLR